MLGAVHIGFPSQHLSNTVLHLLRELKACSDRAENLAEEHVATGPSQTADAGPAVFYTPKGTGRSW